MNGKKTKTHRHYQPIELWSKKFYADKVQPNPTKELNTLDASNHSVRLKSSEVREGINTEIESMKGKAVVDNSSESTCDLSPQEMQQ